MKPTEPPAAPHHHSPEELHNVDVAHEHSDINVRAIVMFLVGLAVLGIVVHVLMWAVFVVLERQAAANDPPLSPLAVPTTEMPATTRGSPAFGVGPAPQLLTNEPAALRQFRAQEEQLLNSYGWVDEQAGVARMPIEEAKKLIVERSGPVRGEQQDPQLGSHRPAYGEASSGRLVSGPPRGAGLPDLAPTRDLSPQHGAQPSPRKGGGH
jgi:hypothetical protein